eukprot:PLAT2485.1.p1 GENE.PLAT2485.1~~PLAT2485.1.p1  ORF type:complete len:848 (+),score=250.09 PLAT2485.1:32-2545(+)
MSRRGSMPSALAPPDSAVSGARRKSTAAALDSTAAAAAAGRRKKKSNPWRKRQRSEGGRPAEAEAAPAVASEAVMEESEEAARAATPAVPAPAASVAVPSLPSPRIKRVEPAVDAVADPFGALAEMETMIIGATPSSAASSPRPRPALPPKRRSHSTAPPPAAPAAPRPRSLDLRGARGHTSLPRRKMRSASTAVPPSAAAEQPPMLGSDWPSLREGSFRAGRDEVVRSSPLTVHTVSAVIEEDEDDDEHGKAALASSTAVLNPLELLSASRAGSSVSAAEEAAFSRSSLRRPASSSITLPRVPASAMPAASSPTAAAAAGAGAIAPAAAEERVARQSRPTAAAAAAPAASVGVTNRGKGGRRSGGSGGGAGRKRSEEKDDEEEEEKGEDEEESDGDESDVEGGKSRKKKRKKKSKLQWDGKARVISYVALAGCTVWTTLFFVLIGGFSPRWLVTGVMGGFFIMLAIFTIIVLLLGERYNSSQLVQDMSEFQRQFVHISTLKWDVMNTVALLALVWKWLQLFFLTYNDNIPVFGNTTSPQTGRAVVFWDAGAVTRFSNTKEKYVARLNKLTDYERTFWPAFFGCVAICVVMPCCYYLRRSAARATCTAKISRALSDVFGQVLDVAFLPILHLLLKGVDCTYVAAGDDSYWVWDRDSDKRCFTGSHIFFFSFALLGILLLQVPASYFLFTRFPRQPRPHVLVFHPKYRTLEFELKAALVAFTEFFTGYTWVRAIVALICNLGFAWLYGVKQQCNVRQVNIWSTAGFIALAWFALYSMLAESMGVQNPATIAPLVLGFLACAALGAAAHARLRCVHTASREAREEQERKGVQLTAVSEV